jgi:AraC-like DNA-binding protein
MIDDIFAEVHGGDEEVRTGPDYFFDNATRGGTNRLIVQWTLGGAGFIEGPRGRQLVPIGHVMLFTHQEPTRYGYPAGATEPYRHRFISISTSSGLHALFERLRADFGLVVRLPEGSEAADLATALFRGFRDRSFRDRFQQADWLYRFFIALYREQVQQSRTTDPVEFGFHYLHSEFRRPVNLKGVAEKCGISREHFIRSFTVRFGEGPGTMLRRLRLQHARAMLSSTQMSVQDVGLASGFASANAFCRAYRLKFGHSPGVERVR